ncbi:MAG: aspartyl protease family protein, partial [bacterium]
RGFGMIAAMRLLGAIMLLALTLGPVPATPVAPQAPHDGPTVVTNRVRFPVAIPFPECGSTVLIPVQVNGHQKRLFILDSGANSMALDHRLADSLGLSPVGSGAGTGAGQGPVPYRRYARDSVEFEAAGIAIRSDHTISIDLSNQPGILGVSVGGVLGTDFFRAVVVEIDYDAHVVWLHRPGEFIPTADARAIPLTFARRVPFVSARLTVPGRPPRERRLLVDSGSEDAVDDSMLLESRGPLRQVTGGVGSGQTYQVVFGRIERFELGPFTLHDLPSVAPGVSLIGGEVLRRFRVALDYGNARMYLAPGRHFSDRSAEDLSGMSLRLTASGERLRVDEVQRDSPAARAGMVAGDEIVAIDGAPIRDLGLRRALAILTRPDARLRVTLAGSSQEREVTLVLPSARAPSGESR